MEPAILAVVQVEDRGCSFLLGFFAAPQNDILTAAKKNVCSLVDTARFRFMIGRGIRMVRNTEIGARGPSAIPEIETLESGRALALGELGQ